jgi:hypothetical protein
MRLNKSLQRNINTAKNDNNSIQTFTLLPDSPLPDNSIGKRPSNNGRSGSSGTKTSDLIKSQPMNLSSTRSINQENIDSAAKT